MSKKKVDFFISRKLVLRYICVFFLIGIVVSLTGLIISFLILYFCLLFVLIILLPPARSAMFLRICLYILIAMYIGVWFATTKMAESNVLERATNHLLQYTNGPIQLTISSSPTKSSFGTTFIGQLSGYEQLSIMVRTSAEYIGLSSGDFIEVKGTLTIPEDKEGETFSYTGHLKKDNIFLILQQATILHHKKNSQGSLLQLLEKSSKELQKRIYQLWPGDVGALIAGILIGTKEGLSPDLKEAFRITGLAHIVAISGFNITIIIVFVFALLSFLPKALRIPCAIFFIILFCLFTGASAAVVRASIMGIIGLVALFFERKSTAFTSLLFSAVIMAAMNPYTLLYDVGFQLSFLAVLGLLYGEPLFEKIKAYIPKKFGIQEALILTLSAQITTTPIILYYFSSFSIVSPLSNILVTPFIPLSMLTSFLTLCCTYIPFFELFVIIGQLVTHLLVQLMISLTFVTAQIPYASIEVVFLKDTLFCILVYMLIFFFLWKIQPTAKKCNAIETIR